MVTEIQFYKSNKLGRPSLHICPEFSQAYDEDAMDRFGIEKQRYKKGDWPRTKGVDEHFIFGQVTLNITHIIRFIQFEFVEDREDIELDGKDVENLKWEAIPYAHFGRCFGLRLDDSFDDLRAVTIRSKIDAIVWVHYHGQMLSPDVKSKFEIIKTDSKCLYLTLTYGVFFTRRNCAEYNSDTGCDFCTLQEAEHKLMGRFNCVRPISNSSSLICKTNNLSKDAFDLHDSTVGKFTPSCPAPCSSMQISFGFPSKKCSYQAKSKLYCGPTALRLAFFYGI